MKTLPKYFLIFILILAGFGSTSFGFFSAGPTQQKFNFKYKDLESGKVLLEKTIMANNQDEALDKGAQECFKELRSRKVEGIEAIDICANPRS